MTTYVTVDVIVQRLIRLSGQVPGTAVEIYSTDVFVDMVNTTMRMVARKIWWPHLLDWQTGVLDGATGVITTDLVGVQDHTDIKAVFIDAYPTPLPRYSDELLPPIDGTTACGYDILPVDHPLYLQRLIYVVPKTATGTLLLRVRKVPEKRGFNDVVPFDQDLMMFGTLWSYFEDEGDNPQQAAKYKALFDGKFTELVASISTHRVSMLGNAPTSGGGWQEVS